LRIPRDGLSQDDINGLLVAHGKRGRRVVRLKGGDPFVFGRGGEEALALARAGVPFEIVPGISAALAAPAAAGIPVTHRGLSGSVTIVNGHDPAQHAWSALARGGGTLVFLMAVEHLEEIVAELLAHGRPAEEPSAIVQWATTSRQRVVSGSLSEIATLARGAGLEAPAVLVVGPTAALAAELSPPRTLRAPEELPRRFAAPLRLSQKTEVDLPMRSRAAASAPAASAPVAGAPRAGAAVTGAAVAGAAVAHA